MRSSPSASRNKAPPISRLDSPSPHTRARFCARRLPKPAADSVVDPPHVDRSRLTCPRSRGIIKYYTPRRRPEDSTERARTGKDEMSAQPKQSIVTFKAEESLVHALRGISNRSMFIRSAILAALDNTCPLCLGAGILTPEQRNHWDSFAADHAVEECGECHERHLVCEHGSGRPAHTERRRRLRR